MPHPSLSLPTRVLATRALATRVLATAVVLAVGAAIVPADAAPATNRDAVPAELQRVAIGGVPAPAPAGAVLVRQQAILTEQVAGAPAPGTPPHRQLAGASVDMEVLGDASGDPTWFLGGDAVLKAAPPTGYDVDALVQLMLGQRSGQTCELDTLADEHETSGYDGTRYEWGGYSGADGYFPAPDRPWTCVVVAVVSPDRQTVYDARVGALTDTYQRPSLAIKQVSLLGKSQKKLRLVRGVPTKVEVRIRNAGEAQANAVTLVGRGKGVRVKKARHGALGGGDTATFTVPVTLTRAKAKLRLKASAAGTTAKRTIRVIATKQPRKPLPGSYRNKSGTVRFQVKGKTIVGWHGTMQQRCGGYGSLPIYQQVTLDFPRTRIPRNGIVQATSSGSKYSVSLRLKAVGGKVTRGLFRYADRAQCSAVITFNARRVGR